MVVENEHQTIMIFYQKVEFILYLNRRKIQSEVRNGVALALTVLSTIMTLVLKKDSYQSITITPSIADDILFITDFDFVTRH